jgi:hypothetical protein
MTRNLKALGLALVAVFAMSAMVASSASATTHFFTSEGNVPVDLTGEQSSPHKFVVAGQAVECTTAKFDGTVAPGAAGISTVTISPTYSSCKYGAKTVHVTMEGCDYKFTGITDAAGWAPVHIVCPVGKTIVLHFTELDGAGTECHLKIAAQTPTQGVKFTNEGAGSTRGVKVVAEAKGIKSSVVATGSPDTICTTLPVGNSTYTGPVPIKGYKDGSAHNTSDHVGVFFHTV